MSTCSLACSGQETRQLGYQASDTAEGTHNASRQIGVPRLLHKLGEPLGQTAKSAERLRFMAHPTRDALWRVARLRQPRLAAGALGINNNTEISLSPIR